MKFILDEIEIFENFWLDAATPVGEYTETVRQEIMHFHEAQCHKTVEPCVCELFDDILIALFGYHRYDGLPLTKQIRRIGIGITIDNGVVTDFFRALYIFITVDAKGLQ